MLQGVDPEYRKQVARTLKWLAFSMRPLYLEEVAEIFILDHENPVPFNEKERLFTPADVLNYLPGLVTKVSVVINNFRTITYGKPATEIRFAHFSIKEYLCSSRIVQQQFSVPEQTAHLYISESCLAYHIQVSESVLASEDALQDYALWRYAALYGLAHLEKVDLESWTTSATHRATSAFAACSRNLVNMVRICNSYSVFDNIWETTLDELATPLYYTASMGIFKLTSLIIDSGDDVNELSSAELYGTALQAAAYRGDRGIVRLLLDKGADVDAQRGEYGNALQVAAYRGDRGIVQLLLDKGADVNAQGGHYGSALQAAAYMGQKYIMQLLLDKGADSNANEGHYGNALQVAACKGDRGIVQLLLNKGADVNTQGGHYGSALQAAARGGDKGIVQLLLYKGADVNAQGGQYGSALQAAITEDHLSIAELLLARGAVLNPPGEEFEELLARVEATYVRDKNADRLRKYQENPSGYIEWRRQQRLEGLDVSSWGGDSIEGSGDEDSCRGSSEEEEEEEEEEDEGEGEGEEVDDD